MRRTSFVSVMLSTCGILGCASAARAQDPGTSGAICPEEIAVEQRLAAPLEGWASRRTQGRITLERIAIYDGHPSELADLVPDGEEPRAGGRIASVWKLSPSKVYWVECAYGRTDVAVFRRLPEKTTRCEVLTDPRLLVNGRAPIVDARCR
ncbi:MAG TPA: STY0301 family protein [Anaeromyxobacteraceae bacterium]|nr:STY0301 family protein [Anaeromyxobacteraceae bacterium]